MKDEIKEIKIGMYSTDEILEFMTNGEGRGFMGRSMYDAILDYITNLQDRTKELEQINEEHRKINGELRKTINEATEYIEYQISQLDFEKDTKAKMLGSMILVLLQGSDE